MLLGKPLKLYRRVLKRKLNLKLFKMSEIKLENNNFLPPKIEYSSYDS